MRPSARPWLAPVLVLLVAGAASAQPFETPPPPAAPRPLAIAAPSEQALPNGLRVVVAPREGVPLVTATLVVLSGSELDPPRLSGLASAIAEAAVLGGNANRVNTDLDDLQRVTAADVQRVMRRYVTGARMVTFDYAEDASAP